MCGQDNRGTAPCTRCLNRAPAWVADGVVAAAPSPSRSRLVRSLALAVVVLLVAGLVGVVAVADDGSVPRVDTSAGGLDADAVEAVLIQPDGTFDAGALDGDARPAASVVAELHDFVARARGLSWKEPVEVTFYGGHAFVNRLQELNERDAEDIEELRETQRILRALHLLDEGTDLQKSVDDLLAAAVVGFYDPETDDMAIRGVDVASLSVRATIVHELVHAIQDQHFDLHRPEMDERDDESADAFSGLVEGDAVRVERMYLDTLSLEERKRAEREELEAAAAAGALASGQGIPQILRELLGFPYLFGPPFVDALIEAGGQARLDLAFAEPPVTTEQILDPSLYLSGVGPVEVEKPSAGGEVIDEGVMGEYFLVLLLSRADDRGGVGDSRGRAWRGDWYRAWDDADKTCVRTRIATADADETRGLQRALDAWRRAHEGVTVAVETAGTIVFTSCA